MLKCFIFSINKVITDVSLFHFLSWKSVFSELNIDITKEQWKVVENFSRVSACKELLKFNKIPYNDIFFKKIINKKNDLFTHLIECGMSPKDIYPGITEFLNEIKKRKILLACSSSSANAVLQLKKMGLYKKFDYVIDYNTNEFNFLSQGERVECIHPVGVVLKKMGLKGCECIGFGNTISDIEQYKNFDVFTVRIGGGYIEDDKDMADFNVDFSGEMPFEQIIFNYYKKQNDDDEKNEVNYSSQ